MSLQKMNFAAILPIILMISIADGGPLTVAGCYSVCGIAWSACYSAAGIVAGTVTAGLMAPIAAMACNAAMASCYAGCTTAIVAPTP